MTPETSDLRPTPEILALIAEIDAFTEVWRAMSAIPPERLADLRRVASVESVGASTRIEGARLSDEEVARLLADARGGPLATRDEQEVVGCAEVLEIILEAWEAIPLTENHILQLHRDLLAHSVKDERRRGLWKSFANHVEAFDAQGASLGVVCRTATPFETPRRMAELIAWTAAQEGEGGPHPLLVVGIFVAEFLEIHPFQDGNGRLSRLLTTLLLLRAGYGWAPYSSLEHVIEQEKEAYYAALQRTQSAPDRTPWLEFFLKALRLQQERLKKDLRQGEA